MQFRIKQHKFLEAIESVSPALDKQGILPVLKCLRLTADKGIVSLVASDMYMTIQDAVEADVKIPGAICVAAAPLRESLRLMIGSDLDITIVENRLQVRGLKSTLHFNTVPADQYPTIPNPATLKFKEATNLFVALNKVVFAHEPVRSENKDKTVSNQPVLNAVLIGNDEVVATDGKRMAIQTHKSFHAEPILAPGMLIKRLARIFSPGVMGACVQGNQLHCQQGFRTASMRLIDGVYPSYQRVLPSSTPSIVTVGATELTTALRMARQVDSAGDPMIAVTFSADHIDIKAESTEVGKIEQRVDAKGVVERSMGLGIGYLLEAIDHHEGAVLTIEIRSANEPIIITEPGYRNIIMPRRLS